MSRLMKGTRVLGLACFMAVILITATATSPSALANSPNVVPNVSLKFIVPDGGQTTSWSANNPSNFGPEAIQTFTVNHWVRNIDFTQSVWGNGTWTINPHIGPVSNNFTWLTGQNLVPAESAIFNALPEMGYVMWQCGDGGIHWYEFECDQEEPRMGSTVWTKVAVILRWGSMEISNLVFQGGVLRFAFTECDAVDLINVCWMDQ